MILTTRSALSTRAPAWIVRKTLLDFPLRGLANCVLPEREAICDVQPEDSPDQLEILKYSFECVTITLALHEGSATRDAGGDFLGKFVSLR